MARKTPHGDPRFKFQEVQKYVSITRHIYNPQSVLISADLGQALGRREEDRPGGCGRGQDLSAPGVAPEGR